VVYNIKRFEKEKGDGTLMKILLVAPGPNEHKKVKLVPFPQASLPLLAALTPPQHEVVIVDERAEYVPFEEQFDLVGITAMTATSQRAYQIADRFREKGTKVVLGGMHPSACPEEALQHADAVVIGEAEGLWEQLLEDLEKGELKKTYTREDFPAIYRLPPSRLDLLKCRYLLKYVFQTTRGCPHGCSFCSVSRFMGRKYRHRDIDNVIEEVSLYQDKTRIIGFLDDNIVSNPRYSKELFRALIPLKKKWVSQGTLNIADDDELISLAQKSGCIALFVGIESVNEGTLKNAHKSFNKVKNYKRLIEKFHQHGIMIIGSFVFGFDEDDTSVFQKTLEFIEDAKIDFAQFSILTPLPGTEIFHKLKNENRIFTYDWSKYDFAHVVYQPARMTAEELQKGYNEVFRKFYSWPLAWKRVLRNWKYLHYFIPATLYYNWVSRHPKDLPNSIPEAT